MELIAIGPTILGVGSVLEATSGRVQVEVRHFVAGSSQALFSLTQNFERLRSFEKYALFNELGFGRTLAKAPSVKRAEGKLIVELCLGDSAQLKDARDNIVTMCGNTGGTLTGMNAYVQLFESSLGMAQGTWFANLASGSHLSDMFWRFRGSDWLPELLKIEMLRLASIPQPMRPMDENKVEQHPPLLSVKTVQAVALADHELHDQRLHVNVVFDLEGLGSWEGMLRLFISTPEQLEEARHNASLHHEKLISLSSSSRLNK